MSEFVLATNKTVVAYDISLNIKNPQSEVDRRQETGKVHKARLAKRACARVIDEKRSRTLTLPTTAANRISSLFKIVHHIITWLLGR